MERERSVTREKESGRGAGWCSFARKNGGLAGNGRKKKKRKKKEEKEREENEGDKDHVNDRGPMGN